MTHEEFRVFQKKVQNFDGSEIFMLCDMGYYNDAIRGYLIVSMRNAKFTKKEIELALCGLRFALDEVTASEASELYRKW